MSFLSFRMAAILLGASALLSGPASAALGGSVSSVRSDSERMGAQMASTAMGRYTRHDLMRVNGGQVHELTNADGQVFAVTWAGPGKPDLRALLGDRFGAFQAASGPTGTAIHTRRRPPQVSQPDLEIQTEGHMGWFRGVAFIPSLAPAGFSTDELAKAP